MVLSVKMGMVAAVGLVGATLVCPICDTGTRAAELPDVTQAAVTDTAVVKLAIRGMTCGSCATTARIALRRTPGVHAATVSFDSASAVVRYDPRQTSPELFIANLARLTGYGATVVSPAAADPEGNEIAQSAGVREVVD